MINIIGINNGAVLQRGKDNLCSVTVIADFKGTPVSSLGTLTFLSENKWNLSGIPVGGPYTITIKDNAESVTFNEIYVGDLWILAGQSNMEGAGRPDEFDIGYKNNPDANIRCYYLNNEWKAAVPILHQPWLSVDACQREVWKRNQLNSRWHSDKPPFISHGTPESGVGPGLFFAVEMYKKTKVPQGVIPCALGGSSLESWEPQDENGYNLYAAMLRRFKRTGSNVCGVLWSQGETETNSDSALDLYSERMEKFIISLRKDIADENLPVVITQTAYTRLASFCTAEASQRWERLRELQRGFALKNKNMDMVATIDCPLDDLIHLSSAGQKLVGKRMANSMAYLCNFNNACNAPKLKCAHITKDAYRPFFAVLELEYSNTKGFAECLNPSGFSIINQKEKMPMAAWEGIASVRFLKNNIQIYTEYSAEELKEMFVKYGCGNSAFCNITTAEGFSLPAFGPLKISELLTD